MLLWTKIHLMPVCIKIRLPNTNKLLNIHHYVPNMYMYLLFWFDDQLFQTLINLYVNYMKPTLFIVYKQSVDVYSGYCSFSNNCLFLVLYSCHKTISMQIIATSFCLFLFYLRKFLGVAAKGTLFFLELIGCTI